MKNNKRGGTAKGDGILKTILNSTLTIAQNKGKSHKESPKVPLSQSHSKFEV